MIIVKNYRLEARRRALLLSKSYVDVEDTQDIVQFVSAIECREW